jgi:DNA-binding MarR family transcriptional regulator
MASNRLSHLQRRIFAWLDNDERSSRGTMAADHRALVQAMGVDKGNPSTLLKDLERKDLIRIHWTPMGKAEAVDLLPARQGVVKL